MTLSRLLYTHLTVFLVKVNNVNVTKFNSNKVDLFTSMDAKQNFIYNVPQPIHPYNVCTKEYNDGLAKKNVTSG